MRSCVLDQATRNTQSLLHYDVTLLESESESLQIITTVALHVRTRNQLNRFYENVVNNSTITQFLFFLLLSKLFHLILHIIVFNLNNIENNDQVLKQQTIKLQCENQTIINTSLVMLPNNVFLFYFIALHIIIYYMLL